MSELINTNDSRATIRWKLLTGVSALALTAYVSSADVAAADDVDRSMVWIELGGQMEMIQGYSRSFIAPFMSVTPTPSPYRGNGLDQSPARVAFDMDGKISFQPEDSDRIFSAGVRYGRSHSKRHSHHQTSNPNIYTSKYSVYGSFNYPVTFSIPTSAFADMLAVSRETHRVLDFQAGKDVGLGLLGRNGSSEIDVGVRIAQFRSYRSVDVMARPEVDIQVYDRTYAYIFHIPTLVRNFHNYVLHGTASRSFSGVGPSLSWTGTATIAGNPQNGELTLDFGVSGAVLFGRQKAKTSHQTQTHYHHEVFTGKYVQHSYTGTSTSAHSTRSRRVTVPELSGFIGLSAKLPHSKISIGYRGDIWLGAMDTGIDARETSNLTFNGPYASISIGLGD